MAGAVMTSIVLKSGVTLMDIVSTRMLGQFGFLGKVFDIFRANEISVDVVATSEISISLTLDPRCVAGGCSCAVLPCFGEQAEQLKSADVGACIVVRLGDLRPRCMATYE